MPLRTYKIPTMDSWSDFQYQVYLSSCGTGFKYKSERYTPIIVMPSLYAWVYLAMPDIIEFYRVHSWRRLLMTCLLLHPVEHLLVPWKLSSRKHASWWVPSPHPMCVIFINKVFLSSSHEQQRALVTAYIVLGVSGGTSDTNLRGNSPSSGPFIYQHNVFMDENAPLSSITQNKFFVII